MRDTEKQDGGPRGGAANTPPFEEPAVLRTAADHQLESGEPVGALPGGEVDEDEPSSDRGEPEGMRDYGVVSGALHRIADRIDEAGDALRSVSAGSRATGGAGDVLHAASDRMDAMSNYLRTHEPEDVRRDLEGTIRRNPVQAAVMGLVAGWVLGKIIK